MLERLKGFIARLEAKSAAVRRIFAYVRGRLGEKSTLLGISSAIAAGGIIPAPYSYYAIGAGILAVFVPEPKKNA
jgi:hypothetical protein